MSNVGGTMSYTYGTMSIGGGTMSYSYGTMSIVGGTMSIDDRASKISYARIDIISIQSKSQDRHNIYPGKPSSGRKTSKTSFV